MNFNSLTIVNKYFETPTSAYITLKIPDKLISKFRYSAGQYVSIGIKTQSGVLQNRCYSICGSVEDRSHLSFCVKKVEGGIVSSYLVDQIKIGEKLNVSIPEGEFTLKHARGLYKKNSVFISAGSGITPIKSIIDKLITKEYSGNIFLVYGNNSKEEVIFYDYFKKLDNEYANFNLILILKETPLTFEGEQGRLIKEKISYLFEEYNLPLKDSIFYISGPLGIINNSIGYLKNHGVEENRIFTEKFFTEAPTVKDSNKIFTTNIKANGISHELKIKSTENILEAALKAGININHSCRTGSCLSCVCTKVSGEVIVQDDSQLSKKLKENKVILACQSYPDSDNLTLDFDKEIKKGILHNRNIIIAFSVFLFLIITFLILKPGNENFTAKGEFNIGHEDLDCIHCHKDAPGTSRQQIQRNLKHFIGIDVKKVDFGTIPVDNDACLSCHARPNDAHPVHRFMEPKFKEAREKIHPEECLSCHAEHKHERVTFKETSFCVNCHKDIKIDNDPLDLKHSELIKMEMWNTCIQCHDFHGNHVMEVATKIQDTIPLKTINDYFNNGKDPYSDIKKYVADLDSINKIKQ